jgi:hypothetical protein
MRQAHDWRPGSGWGRVRATGGDAVTAAIAVGVVALLLIAGTGRAPSTDAAPPPAGGFSHGAAGSARNGFGGSIAPSPTMQSWPGTGAGGNGGPFAFIGAHYGSLWQVPASVNNSRGVGYCVMEDVAGEGAVSLRPDPPEWDTGEMARAAALMSTFGGDRVVPYGIDASGPYDVASGEWHQPGLFGGGEYTRRRHVAVNFGAKMFLEDVSPTGAVAGLKLARDTAVVDGSGGEFAALRNGYVMAQRLADVAEVQHAVGGVRLQLVWATTDGAAPTQPGTHTLEVRASDATGKPLGFVPIVVLSEIGIDGARTVGAVAAVDRSGDSADDAARWSAAASLGWPTMDMAGSMAADSRFGLATNPSGADVTDASGTAHFDVTVTGSDWQLAFHTQAPTADVSLYAGTGIQGQVTWTGPPQSASVHVVVTPPPPPPPPPPPAPAVGAFSVRKVLDAADVQGDRDMSGFEFDVAAADGTPIGRVVTTADGRTPSLEAVVGTYTITEVGRPSWAAGLDDGGPLTFALAADDGADVHEITYTNRVPAASISTAARDALDGDQVVDLAVGDATIVDTVRHSGLVPGTAYVVSGELMVRPSDGGTAAGDSNAETIVAGSTATETVASSTVALVEMIPTGITGSTTFVPSESDGQVEVEFTVPADSPLVGHVVVVYQRLAVASSGRIVAVHADPDAVEQTVRFADITPPTTVPPTTVPATTVAPTTALPTTVPSPPPTTAPDVAAAPPTTAPPTTAPSTTGTPPSAPVASTTPRPTPGLASTGSGAAGSTLLSGVALLLLGVGALIAARRERPANSGVDGRGISAS